ncbi:hypothetical protein E2320_019099 [Naja naja]|nr:hypothetical protein E2320_019099 [Naja naja]
MGHVHCGGGYSALLRQGTAQPLVKQKLKNLILEQESTENIKTSPPELNYKSNEDEIQKDPEDANKQLESEEKEDQPSVSPSNDVGFKKLLDVKPEVTEGSNDVAGDYKQFKTETAGKAT